MAAPSRIHGRRCPLSFSASCSRGGAACYLGWRGVGARRSPLKRWLALLALGEEAEREGRAAAGLEKVLMVYELSVQFVFLVNFSLFISL